MRKGRFALRFIVVIFIGLILAGVGGTTMSSCSGNDQSAMIQDTTLSLVVREWSKKIQENPKNGQYYFERGKALLKERRKKLAIADFEKSVELLPQAEYQLQLAEAYFVSDKTKKAMDTYEEAVKLYPNEAATHRELGVFQYYLLKYDEAEKTLLKAIELDNYDTESYFTIGMLRKEKSDTAGAITFFRKALQSNYDHFESYMQISNLMVDLGDTMGFQYLSNAFRLQPENPEVLYATGLLYQRIGDTEKAIELYQQTVDIEPRFVSAYYNTGSILAQQGKYRSAIDHFQLAINFAPKLAKAYTRRGQCLELVGEGKDAKFHYEKALEFDPNDVLAKEGLIRITEN